MINPSEVLNYSQVSRTYRQSMFKACTKCCYETLAEILNKMAFPNLGLCNGRLALSLHGCSADSHRMLPLSTSGSQQQQASRLPASQHPQLPARHCWWQLVLERSALNWLIPRHNCPLRIQGRIGTEGTARDSSHAKTFPGLTMGLGGKPFC